MHGASTPSETQSARRQFHQLLRNEGPRSQRQFANRCIRRRSLQYGISDRQPPQHPINPSCTFSLVPTTHNQLAAVIPSVSLSAVRRMIRKLFAPIIVTTAPSLLPSQSESNSLRMFAGRPSLHSQSISSQPESKITLSQAKPLLR